MEAGKRLHIGSFGNEGILRGRQILVPEGDAAGEDFVVTDRQLGARHLVEPGKRGLRTGVQSLRARGHQTVSYTHLTLPTTPYV